LPPGAPPFSTASGWWSATPSSLHFHERVPTKPDDAERLLRAEFVRPAQLAELGIKRHDLSGLVGSGMLVRLRNGRYVSSQTHPRLLEAGRYGGRLDCVSLASALGVFVRRDTALHLQFTPGTARLPSRPAHVVAHWRRSEAAPCALASDLVEALVQACRCQQVRDAVATLDSAWHLDLIGEAEIAEIFRRLPLRYAAVRHMLDPRSESGAETLMRILLRALGCDVAVQVAIPGVGRVDLVVDGWLIVECDSKAFHEGWAAQARDRRRDLAAAALGYTTVRPLAEDIYYRRDGLVTTMKAIVSRAPAPPARQNSTDPAAEPPV
jgi:very-short-patch-repair endonuclease